MATTQQRFARAANARSASPTLGLALVVALCSSPAFAQATGTPPDTDDPPVLRGPSVEPAARADSLIRLGYDGRVQRLEDVRPEVAALELVDLDDQARATIDALIEQRAAFLDGAVLEHYQTLLELYAAFGAGDQTEVARLYMEFAGHLQPLFEGGGLARQLAREMRPAQAREYGRLIREYYQAVAQDALDHPEATRGSAATLQDALRNERIGVLMQEVGRSFGRIVQQKSQELEDVLAALRLDPDREAQIRALVEEIAGDFGLNPSESEKREIFTRIMGELTPGERQRLMAWILR
ncbi:MAG: hypothetical protein H6809_04085 [Phycisphaeraceae bacterium]|nr:hypothetical protein [Phycisphaeraceae bacterium]